MKIVASILLSVFLLLPWGEAHAIENPNTLLLHGERFLRIGNLNFAMANYSQVVECCEGSPEAAEAHADIGVIYARQGSDDLAIAEYEKALTINDYPLAHFNLGQALLRKPEIATDPALKAKALKHFQAFADYLASGKPRPPIVEQSMATLEAELKEAFARLRP